MSGLIKFIKNRFFPAPSPYQIADRYRARGMSIGAGTRIYPNVVFGRGGQDPIQIGDNCTLTGCTILGHDASTNPHLDLKRSMIKPVIIEDDCFIGIGSIILMGVTIGKGSIVGAGAVVTRSVPPGSVVTGNPASVLCHVDQLVAKRQAMRQTNPEFFPEPEDKV